MSSLSNPFSYAALPNDIGRLIFEFLAESGAPSCSLVSKRVQSWVERIIYREVALTTKEKGALFHRTAQEALAGSSNRGKSKDFLASSVKCLYIKYEVDASVVAPILKVCTGVIMLALYIPDTHANKELWEVTATDWIRPTRLAIPGSSLPPANRDFLQPIFQNVTHLELLWEDEDSLDFDWATLRRLRQLTHLSIDMQFDPDDEAVVDVAQDLLGLCPQSVRIMILWVIFSNYFEPGSGHYKGIMALHAGAIDPRVVVGYSANLSKDDELPAQIASASLLMRFADVEAGWSTPLRAKMDMWDLAEERIEKRSPKRAGESQAPRFDDDL